MAEGGLKCAVQHGRAHVQEGLHRCSAPAHLLRLVHALGHDRVDRALHERGRDRLTTPTPSSVMHQRCLVAVMATWLHAVVLAVMYRDGFMFGCDHESRVTCKVLGLAVAHIPSHPGMRLTPRRPLSPAGPVEVSLSCFRESMVACNHACCRSALYAFHIFRKRFDFEPLLNPNSLPA